MPTTTYRVSAIISTFAAEHFIAGCLDDLLAQTISDQLQIIVIDSGSPQNEGDIVRRYQKTHPNITYVRTERETIYQAWNRAIKLAKGTYLTNANTDDRHREDAYEILSNTLDQNPNIALTYADQKISVVENEIFTQCSTERIMHLPKFCRRTLLKGCLTGSQPMWRTSVHEEIGYFSEELKIAGDYEMWLRMAQHWDFLKLDEVLGLYFNAEQGLEHANQYLCDIESIQLVKKYLPLLCEPVDRKIKREISSLTFSKGYNRYIQNGDIERGKVLLKHAIKLDPLASRFYKTYLLRCILKLRFK